MSEPNVVLINGASSGIGRTTADLLAQRRCRVFGTARDAAKAAPISGVDLLSLDVRDEASANACVEEPDFTNTQFGAHTVRSNQQIDAYGATAKRAMAALAVNLERAPGPTIVASEIVCAIERRSGIRRPAGARARLLSRLRRFMPLAPVDRSIRRVLGLSYRRSD